jgi:ribosomal protein S18 acetylase RimI-like enzyme
MVSIRPIEDSDRPRLRDFMQKQWGSTVVAGHGVLYTPHELDGWVAVDGDDWVGVVTVNYAGGACEIVTLDSVRAGQGVGTALIAAVLSAARKQGCLRVWLITTNDNTQALRFYQKRGFELVALRRGAIHAARALKPSIPLVGNDGIPLRDELELEIPLMIVGAA